MTVHQLRPLVKRRSLQRPAAIRDLIYACSDRTAFRAAMRELRALMAVVRAAERIAVWSKFRYPIDRLEMALFRAVKRMREGR